MEIDYLSNYPEQVKVVSQIIFREFVVKNGSNMNYEEVYEFFSNTEGAG
ncbi:hypothetical protein [Bacillus sp. SA1-12]|nr:hypothetical protein [Bacillus sp. SA1-12]